MDGSITKKSRRRKIKSWRDGGQRGRREERERKVKKKRVRMEEVGVEQSE